MASKLEIPFVPAEIPTTDRPLGHWLGVKVLTFLGWRVVGEIPKYNKAIYAVAPHTSNWDFVIGVAAMLAMRIKLKFMGKSSIFIWPFKSLLVKLGGIPIERSKKHGIVEQMVDKFQQSDDLILALAPEGTRSKTTEWKTGFLAIAHKANVPVVTVTLHFDKKEIRFGQASFIGEDIPRELKRIKSYYADACAKNPQAA